MHWTKLRNEIETNGLKHLIAESSEQAKIMLENNMFEPLLWAHNCLAGLVFNCIGYKPGCPICNIEKTDFCKLAGEQARVMHDSLHSNEIKEDSHNKETKH